MDPVPSTQAAGQISADGQFRWDGQQWVPLPAISAISGVLITIAFVNHDSVLRAIHAQGTQIPVSTSVDTVVNITIGVTYGVAIFFSLLYLVAALGSYLGWRWMFWAALVLYGLSGITVFTNIGSFANPDRSPIPVAGLIISELFAVLGLAMFVWMLVAVIKFGPWAMKKAGR